MTAGTFRIAFSLQVDQLTIVMLLVVTFVSTLVHIYSTGYMAHEGGYYRFFCYLNLFVFFMLTLVLASNLIVMFVGWEGVGLCSYLLIGFWFLKQSAISAGKKAFITTRLGDTAFTIGILLAFWTFSSLNFGDMFKSIVQMPSDTMAHAGVLTIIAILLFIGAIGKSAQIPLYVWLPDAMEGPTPVSALIHAATMVTAGVYMVARMNPLFSRAPIAMLVVAIVGAATALFAATIGLVQTDIKKVLAYSTVSQLGYMFLGCGVGAYAAGIFHLMTHAFFKGLLFLAAGSVIHAMGGEQDMRHMGGLRKQIPITYWTMLIGTIAIAGIPGFSGFFSKDEILDAAGSGPHKNTVLWLLGLIGAGLTSFYMFRLVFLTFFGKERFDHHKVHVHESPKSMTIPLILLAILSLGGGWVAAPHLMGGTDHFEAFLHPVFAAYAPQEAGVEQGASLAGDAGAAGEISGNSTMEGIDTRDHWAARDCCGRWPAAGVVVLHPQAGAAGEAREKPPRALRASLQQVLCRRNLQRAVCRAAAFHLEVHPVARHRRRNHRRRREWHGQCRPRFRRQASAAAIGQRSQLRLVGGAGRGGLRGASARPAEGEPLTCRHNLYCSPSSPSCRC